MTYKMDVDKLSYEIFSILESHFLFGYPETPPRSPAAAAAASGKVRVLSIDADSGLLATTALSQLESSLQKRSNNPAARVADFFDVAAGSGPGGVLAAMLFTRGPEGRPLFTADQSLPLLFDNRNKGLIARILRRKSKRFQVFAGLTMRDTVKPLLVPCHDLTTAAPFLFSRADAVECEGYDFLVSDVCAATCAGSAAREVRSVDGRTRVSAVGGAGNPAAAAITHVLNNKREFPFAAGVGDLLVLSIGGAAGGGGIAAAGLNDTVDQAVAMAFGESRASGGYVRIQGSGREEGSMAERSVESVMFRGRRMAEQTNGERLEWFAGELVKEEERRMRSDAAAGTVAIKQGMTPPRSSSATTSFTMSAATSSSSSS